jgi:hypothetical protein
LDLIHWQRGKAGTVEHAHHVLTNELAAEALPSQRFGANAAWFRLNALLDNLLSAFKRVALPEELHNARPKPSQTSRPHPIRGFGLRRRGSRLTSVRHCRTYAHADRRHDDL